MKFESPEVSDKEAGEKLLAAKAAEQTPEASNVEKLFGKAKEEFRRFGQIAALAAALSGLSTPTELAHAGEKAKKERVSFTAKNAEKSELQRFVPRTEADRLAKDFPASLENFEPTEYILTEGSKQTVVWFPQLHMLSEEALTEMNLTDSARWGTLNNQILSQKRIYSAITNLAHKLPFKKVCAEGVIDPSSISWLNEQNNKYLARSVSEYVAPYLPQSNLAKTMQAFGKAYPEGKIPPEDRTDYLAPFEPTMERYVETYRYIVGGAQLASAQGSIRLCPAENRETYDAGWSKEVQKVKAKPEDKRTREEKEFLEKVIMEDREDAALRRAASEKDPLIAVTYGAAHDPRNNVKKWNAEHPEHTLSMLIAKPEFELGPLSRLLGTAHLTFDQLYGVNFAMEIKLTENEKLNSKRIGDGMEKLRKMEELKLTKGQLAAIEEEVRRQLQDRPSEQAAR